MDKLLHFGACLVVSFAVGWQFPAGLAVGKEVGDYMNYGKKVGLPSFAKMAGEDLTADGIGIAVGLVIRELI